jgi:hypothetical protein
MTLNDVCQQSTGSPAAPTLGRCVAHFTRFVLPYELAISVPRHDIVPARPLTAVDCHARRNGSTPAARARIRSRSIASTM